MTRRGKFILAGVILAVAIAYGIVDSQVKNSRNRARAPYAGTYVLRGGGNQRLELRKDGTWTMDYGGRSTSKSQCSSGGSILDSCWEVVSAHEACADCQGTPSFKNFSGDSAIFIPTQVAVYRRATPVRMYGDYYGVVRKGRVLRDEAGQRWSR